MKKIVLILFGVLSVGGGAAGTYFYVNSDSPDSTKLIGSAYWGPTCELSPTGFLICTNESGLRFDRCSTGSATYRLKVSMTEPRYEPLSLEIWTENPRRYSQLNSGQIYGEGTGACFYESYQFKDPDILINKGSNCGPNINATNEPTLMFYVSDETGSSVACKISDAKPAEAED